MDWETVETFWSVEEAQLALSFLQTEEIPCRLEGVAFAGNFWHLANATGGVKLQVPHEAAARAVALLDAVQGRHNSDSTEGPEAEQDNVDDEPASDAPAFAEADDDDPDLDPAADDHDHDEDDDVRPGLFDRLRNQKLLIIVFLVVPMFMGVILGVLGLIMTLFLSLTNQR